MEISPTADLVSASSIGLVEDVVRVMVEAKWHTYKVLTKRADRLSELLSGRLRFAASNPHIWWGVSVEDKKYGLPRIDQLRRAPAATRFLSIEPLLEDLGDIDLSGIHWAIVGGESGPGARPMAQAWVESILGICKKNGITFFFKQWGGVHKSTNGRILKERTFDDMPKRTPSPIPSRQERQTQARAWSAKAEKWGQIIADPLVSLQIANA